MRARRSLGGGSKCALLQPAEQRAREDAAHGGAHSRARGEQEADAERKRDHPLAHGRVGQHVVDEVRGGVGHTPAAAGGAEAAAFASKRDELIAHAARAVHAREAVGEQAALEVAAQLALDEARQAVARIGSTGALEKGLEVGEQRLMQHAALGLAATTDVGLAAQQHAAPRTVGPGSRLRSISVESA
jgi:hypothetical protein